MDYTSVHEALAEIFATCEEIDSEVAGIKQEVLLLERLINGQAPLRKLPATSVAKVMAASSSSGDSPPDADASTSDVAG